VEVEGFDCHFLRCWWESTERLFECEGERGTTVEDLLDCKRDCK
jgi:hypothetical protein